MTTSQVKGGFQFTHLHTLQPEWRPDVRKGEKYKDAPKAAMVVTSVRNGAVYYTYSDSLGRPLGKGAWYTSTAKFLAAYAPELVTV
jgi:hypothetical protein